jgi:hypothetical protein
VPVVALDTYRGIDAESACAPPVEHISGDSLIKEPMPCEVTKHPTLYSALEGEPVIGGEIGRFVEEDRSVIGLGKYAIDDDEVVVEVRVEAGAESVWEGSTRITGSPI